MWLAHLWVKHWFTSICVFGVSWFWNFHTVGCAQRHAHWSQPTHTQWRHFMNYANHWPWPGMDISCIILIMLDGTLIPIPNEDHFCNYPNYPPLLGRTLKLLFRQGSKICIRTRNWPPRTLQMQRHWQIRRLRDSNPMGDVLDQDSSNKPGH